MGWLYCFCLQPGGSEIEIILGIWSAEFFVQSRCVKFYLSGNKDAVVIEVVSANIESSLSGFDLPTTKKPIWLAVRVDNGDEGEAAIYPSSNTHPLGKR